MNNKFIIDKVEIIPLKNYDDNNYSFNEIESEKVCLT